MTKNYYILALAAVTFVVGYSDRSYPENTTQAEREEYYHKFDESKTKEEWEAIRAQKN